MYCRSTFTIRMSLYLTWFFLNSNKGPVSLKSLVIIKNLEYVFSSNLNEPSVFKITRACLRCTL